MSSNPSSPPTPYKNGSILLNSYTIKDILKQSPNKKIDLYAKIIAISEAQQSDTKYGPQYTKNICLSDGTDIIWASLQQKLLNQHQNDFILENQIVLRNMIIEEQEGVVQLIDDIWTSVQTPESVEVNYFTL
ncbi:unnamed protein product [Paramecium primaurelia]|uniref:Uncharacterized protein n=1 Tax=Paramecium primaurelia TaxID=5886 RepID=A0A8S1MDN5_PARPR|nr:unnamed protein product [Paramecium primaurelia]